MEIDWSLAADVFADALEQPLDQRAEFVLRRCAGQSDLQAAVERMLAAERAAGPGFLEGLDPSFIEAVATTVPAPIERIGPWRLLREIGRGGMGQVFLAERADGQFDQQVAVKLLKRGMDTDAILARFLRERQILAALDHPNIARLLDGGIAGDGRPYFLMEYVDGQPITAFADAQRLPVEARLDLFCTVCTAVEYAHRNLVVHRDLKPSNILVSTGGRPKLLDFGIAKLLSGPDERAEAGTLTDAGIRLLTPDYAAPEQFRGEPITTSTDVYGLGAVLYELLSGRRPFAADEAQITLERDREPPTLSTVTRDGLRDGMADIAEARSTDPVRLRRRLAGDLDTIVATALRTAPERRYASVGELHEDLRRHLERLPVRARPDTFGYRMSRFVRRHSLGVMAASTIALLLIAFGITASLQARAIGRERDRARLEASAAREVAEFLVGIFEVADPMQSGQGDDVRASDLLDRGAVRIETDLAGQPAVQARLLGVIGRAFDNLRRRDRAEPLLTRAVDLQRATEGPESSAVVEALQQLARVRTNLGDFPQAEAALREAIAIQQRIEPDGAAMWGLFVDLAHVIHGTGDYQRGSAAVADVIALFRQLPAHSFGDSRAELRRMAELLGFSREWESTDSVYARLVEVERATTGERSAPVAAAFVGWAESMRRRGQLAVADSMLVIALNIQSALDATSLGTAHVLGQLASVALIAGDNLRVDSLSRAAIEILRGRLGEDHRDVAIARSTLADALQRRGSFDEAIATHRQVNATLARDENDAVVLLPASELRLASALRNAGRLSESIVVFEKALRAFETHYPPDYLITANVRRDLGEALVDSGRAADAEPMLRQAIPVLSARWGEEDFRVDIARLSLGRALSMLGQTDEARQLLREVRDRLMASRGADDQLARRAQAALDDVERGSARTGV